MRRVVSHDAVDRRRRPGSPGRRARTSSAPLRDPRELRERARRDDRLQLGQRRSASAVSFTARRYESVAAMTSFPASNRTRMPVSTGRDSSRDAERATPRRSSRAAPRGRPVKSHAARRRAGAGSPRTLYVCSAVARRARTRSRATPSSAAARSRPRRRAAAARCRRSSRPGTTTAPSSSTSASSDARSESSMSVAASSSRPASARRQNADRAPARRVRVETARATSASFCASSSCEHVSFSTDPTSSRLCQSFF